MKKLSFVLGLLFFVHGCGGSKNVSTPIEQPTDSTIVSFIEIMNDYRESLGCPRLIWDAELAGVAQDHSEDMNQNNYLSHENLQGKTPFDRMQDNDIEFTAAAENIALNSQGAQAVFDAWMESSGHKANIENCVYTHHGVGLEGSYWTHMFMKPSDT